MDNNIEHLGKDFIKPPIKLFGFVVHCVHVWKRYWHKIDECNSVELERCARCEKDKTKWKGCL